MARTIRRLLVGLSLLASAALSAQASSQPAAVDITLGQAAVPLYGPWRFHIGDSPLDPKTGKPRWADPDFDDSQWETIDLTPKGDAVDPIAGISGYVPGWTAHGHPGSWGYAWYRIRLRCDGQNGQPLALAASDNVDDAYQAFLDGTLVGSFGNFAAKQPVIYGSQPLMFRLPLKHAVEGVLAFRVWMDPGTLIQTPDAGGMHSAPLLGEADVVTLRYQSQWLEYVRGYLTEAVEAVAFGLVAIVAFSLILFDRSDRVYPWIGLLVLLAAFTSAWDAISQWTQWIPQLIYQVILDISTPLEYALWVIVWWLWFGRRGMRWLPRAVGGLTLLLAVTWIVGHEDFPGLVSHPAALRLYAVNQVLRIAVFGLLVWVVADAIRRGDRDGWLVLPVVLLRGYSTFGNDLSVLHFPVIWFPLGIRVTTVRIAQFLIAVVIALLLLRRLLQSVKRQREMALDVKQAQEVQQVILPEHRIVFPGLEIESEYRPAREVGGDFFQIIPQAADNSLLIVAGDVAGKGLKAGMLVALLVGAIRTAAETDSDPSAILAALNRRLLGRGDARATCLALRIERDGAVTLANAGHLPPYLNGEPLEIEGSLPLGMIGNLECSVLDFRLAPIDRLLLVSDGVPEATNQQGKLLGFDRVLELVRTQPSAAMIANTAQAFGQEDDISVISVTRVPLAEVTAQPSMA